MIGFPPKQSLEDATTSLKVLKYYSSVQSHLLSLLSPLHLFLIVWLPSVFLTSSQRSAPPDSHATKFIHLSIHNSSDQHQHSAQESSSTLQHSNKSHIHYHLPCLQDLRISASAPLNYTFPARSVHALHTFRKRIAWPCYSVLTKPNSRNMMASALANTLLASVRHEWAFVTTAKVRHTRKHKNMRKIKYTDRNPQISTLWHWPLSPPSSANTTSTSTPLVVSRSAQKPSSTSPSLSSLFWCSFSKRAAITTSRAWTHWMHVMAAPMHYSTL